MQNTNKKGFTLLELMVVVVIIGVLSVLAVPQFAKSRETSRLQSALPLLRTIALGNKMHKLDNNSYADMKTLIEGKYIADDLEKESDTIYYSNSLGYSFIACVDSRTDASCKGTPESKVVALAKRKGGKEPYSNWWIYVDEKGNCVNGPGKGNFKMPDCTSW